MRLHAIVLVILGVLTFGTSSAMAGQMHFSIFGDGTFSTTDTTGATNPDAKLGVGGGAQVEFGLGPMAGLEIGVIYLGRKIGTAGTTVESTATFIQIPVQLRYWVGHYLSLGAGGYFASEMGDIHNSDGSTSVYTGKKTDYGLLGSVGLNFPMSPSTSFFTEGRYAMGLADMNNPAVAGVTTKWHDIQVLVGLRFGGGSR